MDTKYFKYHKIIYLLCCGMLLIACKKKFLDIDPKGYLIAQKTEDYDLILNDVSTLAEISSVSTVLMSDELATSAFYFESDTRLLDQNAFKWADDLYTVTAPRSEFFVLSQQLYLYNKVINEVLDSEGDNMAQKKMLRAEALAGRAYIYFMLVNFYGKPYQAVTAASDLGVPLLKIADATQTKFTRASVQEAYDQILADLNEAMPDLPAKVSSRVRMSKAAGEALLGKVYMFMGSFDKALPWLDRAVADLQNASVAVGLYDFNKELLAGGVWYPINSFTGPPRSDAYKDKEILYLKRATNQYYYLLSAMVVNPQTMALFGANDQRLKFLSPYPLAVAQSYPLGMRRAYGKGYSNFGIGVADIYLLRAECRSRMGDIGTAATELLEFRKNRMPAAAAVIPASATANKVALTKFILEERIREFAVDGARWFDMRRLSVDPEYAATVGKSHQVYDDNGNVVASYALKPERFTLRLPLYILAANPAMPQNP
ncbi:RagB/SusD family nutrient uptake outer membrane protein [Pedobacter sp. KR3-3]|uniref:RagB/SusD family nutrient uptake outer membrane protein n=1 Tax=Pedobacter albus TaxID=3113905 RepID=A0ABU7I404_9SPHI|nr:RagB/SusD family nutrient uptake outer membrane protein [Pedobacter sp. KR3-3]MEE1944195.1 RagB/SusD family nutrient uptake outer membrane protein [Pedobacter sp. KR3-3]